RSREAPEGAGQPPPTPDPQPAEGPDGELPAAGRRRPGEGRRLRGLHRGQAGPRPADHRPASEGAGRRWLPYPQADQEVDLLPPGREGDPEVHQGAEEGGLTSDHLTAAPRPASGPPNAKNRSHP